MDSSVNTLRDLRHTLHQYPELSGQEVRTAQIIGRYLGQLSPAGIIEHLGGHGIAVVFEFSADGPVIMVRCELDALPIQEEGDMAWRSTTPGVAHMCGHDGHMTMVAGLAESLKNDPPARGKVVLLFQPAEETGAGARQVLEEEQFKQLNPDHVVALHNLPGYPKGAIVCRSGLFTASVTSVIIELKGKTAHAGEPENGINPARAISEIIHETSKLKKPSDQSDFALITPIQINMGEEAFGVSAGWGELKFTLRTWDKNSLDALCDKVVGIVEKAAGDSGLEYEISWTQSFASCRNDESMTRLIKKTAEELELNIIETEQPFKWGEDFGLFTHHYSGAMFGLGAGEDTPALHNPDYDFPDDIIPYGVNMFRGIIDKLTAI